MLRCSPAATGLYVLRLCRSGRRLFVQTTIPKVADKLLRIDLSQLLLKCVDRLFRLAAACIVLPAVHAQFVVVRKASASRGREGGKTRD
uniref:Uncharacterized protein n=1 Tax=Setaria viridis TaxID=4556 RepID=A0A4U6UCD0_SETVI|nr:hypothetical protein SEVIR_5G103420v2 [Setaria viridis]